MKIKGRLLVILPLGSIDTSIGKLAIFSLSMGNMESLMKLAGGSLESVSPDEFIKHFIAYTCYREADLNKERERPHSQSLSLGDVKRLRDDEIEAIAAKYIECSPSLTRGDKITKDKKGNNVTLFSKGEIKCPREDDEPSVHYLYRLQIIQEKEIEESNAKLAESIIGAATFSTGLFKDIAKIVSRGNLISKVLEDTRLTNIDKWSLSEIPRGSASQLNGLTDQASIPTPIMPQIDYESIRENRLAPFEDLGNRLDKLIEATETMVEISRNATLFSIDSNVVQTHIASEIKEAGEAASIIGNDSLEVARRSHTVTRWIIGLTIFGISLTLFMYWQESSDSKYLNQQAEQFVLGLDDLSNAVNSDRKTAGEELRVILSQIDKNRTSQNEQVSMILDQQAKLIQLEMRGRIQDQQTIKKLEQKLSTMENNQKTTKEQERKKK